jgi:hypothetical protein
VRGAGGRAVEAMGVSPAGGADDARPPRLWPAFGGNPGDPLGHRCMLADDSGTTSAGPGGGTWPGSSGAGSRTAGVLGRLGRAHTYMTARGTDRSPLGRVRNETLPSVGIITVPSSPMPEIQS